MISSPAHQAASALPTGLAARKLLARAQALLPLFTTAATLGAAGWVYLADDHRGAFVGFAQAVPEALAPVELGRIKRVAVALGDRVEAGQVIVELDTSALDAELAVALAERTRLEAQAAAEQAMLDERLSREVSSLQRERQRAREEQRRAASEQRAIDGHLQRVRRLVDEHQAVASDLVRLDTQLASVSAAAAEKPGAVRLLSDQLSAAEGRRSRLSGASSVVASRLEAELAVADSAIERLRRRRDALALRATRAGQVLTVHRQAGEVAATGEPIVTLTSARSQVRACLPERSSAGVQQGDRASLWPRGQRGAAVAGRVLSTGAAVIELPPRCWLSPGVPVWGREALIELDDAASLLPGQAFDVRISPGAQPSPPLAAAPASATAPASNAPPPEAPPRPLRVPEALTRATRFEPSGLLARPGTGRLWVVSDDTGLGEKDEGKPWIFSMSYQGVVDEKPIELRGVRKINDLEAIAAGPGGEVYLLSSQSHSARGKRRPERTALLRARPEGDALAVDGETHLAELLDADPEQAAALGLAAGTRALDIEGMAGRDGALYLGLKAPLDAEGRAMIWKIAAPAALFGARGARPLVDAKISLWARARVDVELGEQPVAGGISELLFLPDGALILASTPSTTDGDAGAIWRVDAPAPGPLSPRLLARFTDLKPEGLAPSLTPGRGVVVFDTGSRPPRWQEIAWAP